ncbi:uncharacterized protein N7477_006753 [Penicillium maclennaniae]|uniref:uncharacterized protein n=1 Tax=Penicillium maclennaniae TaxID=1343394 RepID=UPI002540B27F|nr:uncharacterized protein N7477_006753 [Penicillium maclennaniae]KAJ5668183.1 hypothetical protein N7477_006753 [Penicillium maclennaniae]
MDERAFLGMKRSQGFDVAIDTDRRSSLLAEMVRLNRILLQINDLNIRASEEELDTEVIISNLEDLSNQLDVWLQELPDHMRDTRENMERYAAQGLGRMFAAIYLGYYHYGQMLFYRFLQDDSKGYLTQTRYFADKCKQHASKLCDTVYASDEKPGCDVKYNMIGHVLVVSSTVQIHSLLFDPDDSNVALAKMRLQKNFIFLTRLRDLWPTLDFCMDRLMAFHEACRNSADTSFRMDRWMVRFLVEFASPMGDKAINSDGKDPWSLAGLGITPL